MKKLAVTKNVLVIGVFLLSCFVDVGAQRCESKRAHLGSFQPQAHKESIKLEKDQDNDWQNNKSGKFKELEWLIMQNLLKQYEKLDADAELADLAD